jgi:hypothetical protein
MKMIIAMEKKMGLVDKSTTNTNIRDITYFQTLKNRPGILLPLQEAM